MSRIFTKSFIVASAAMAVACSGSGGDDAKKRNETPASAEVVQRSLSGTLMPARFNAFDTDTNDSQQVGRKGNNGLLEAQVLNAASPLLLLGSVDAGKLDDVDVYKVALQEGQVVEFEFGADTKNNDLDLFVLDSDSQVVGQSFGSSGYECVKASHTGSYHVLVRAQFGASVYNLHIGAPSSRSSCPNATSTTRTVAVGEVVTKRVQGIVINAATQAHIQAMGDTPLNAALQSKVPSLLRMPRAGRERQQAMVRAAQLAYPKTGQALPMRLMQPQSVADANAQDSSWRDVLDTVHYAKTLMRTGLFAYAEPNHEGEFTSVGSLVGKYPPNDKLYTRQQWHYEQIGLPQAMSKLIELAPQLGGNRPLVAVIDTGIVSDHPDLAPQMVEGGSFTRGGVFSNHADDPSAPDEKGLVPYAFHGTHVAGTIAASTFDAFGTAGVAPMAQLMPIRVADPQTARIKAYSEYDVAQAILYAARLPNSSGRLPARRADVINMSLGRAAACPAQFADAIKLARAAGVIVVASSGNESANTVSTPANCPGVVSVGATDLQGQKTTYSNAGDGLMVMAPGGGVKSGGDFVFSTFASFVGGQRQAAWSNNAGTSMASPHVAGVIALMRYVNPNITPDQINALFASGQLSNDLGAPGYDTQHGWGLISAPKAVDAALASRGAPVAPVAGSVVAQPESLDFGAFKTRDEFMLNTLGNVYGEKVTSVLSGSPAVKVTPKTVDADTYLGIYTVHVDRARLPAGESHTVPVTITTTRKQFNASLNIQKGDMQGASFSTPDQLASVYVQLLDPGNQQLLGQVKASTGNGRYTWSYSGKLPSKVHILAGTDLNDDHQLCSLGEACGAFETLGTTPTTVNLTGDRNDLNFDVAPVQLPSPVEHHRL